jgi:hypothetical protein
MFRLTINDEKTNKDSKLLGDRTLAVWLGKNPGIFHLTTYSYQDLNG